MGVRARPVLRSTESAAIPSIDTERPALALAAPDPLALAAPALAAPDAPALAAPDAPALAAPDLPAGVMITARSLDPTATTPSTEATPGQRRRVRPSAVPEV